MVNQIASKGEIMKKLILLITVLIFFGCEETLEPEDACGVAGGDGTTCADCAGVPNGLSYLDECGGCDANANNDCVQDCVGVFGGTAGLDDCGVCDGFDGYVAGSCYDCANTPNGTAELDNCNVCDTDKTNDCVPDCAGVWGGTTIEDCNGECGGYATVDGCGTCDNYLLNDCDNSIEMGLEIMSSSIYNISDWFYGEINLATLTIRNLATEEKDISIRYQGIIDGETVVEGQTRPLSLGVGDIKVISNLNFDPYSIWWYSNNLTFTSNLMNIGHLLTGNYSIHISASECTTSCWESENWESIIGYTSTDTLYYFD